MPPTKEDGAVNLDTAEVLTGAEAEAHADKILKSMADVSVAARKSDVVGRRSWMLPSSKIAYAQANIKNYRRMNSIWKPVTPNCPIHGRIVPKSEFSGVEGQQLVRNGDTVYMWTTAKAHKELRTLEQMRTRKFLEDVLNPGVANERNTDKKTGKNQVMVDTSKL